MPTIAVSQRPAIVEALGSAANVFGATVARLYTAAPSSRAWQPLKSCGALVLMKDNGNGGTYLKLVEFAGGKGFTSWEHELYNGFVYHEDQPFFHSFESDDCMIGLSFPDESEAGQFHALVCKYAAEFGTETLVSWKPPTPTSVGNANTKQSFATRDGGERSNTSQAKSPKSKVESPKKGNFVRFFGSSSSKKEKMVEDSGPRKLTKDDISGPSNFRHLAHVGFNPETGAFDIQNIPPEWKQIFDKAGVSRKQLENKQTARTIMKFVEQASIQPPTLPSKASSKARGPPPPPPAKTIKGTSKTTPSIRSQVSDERMSIPIPPPPPAPSSRSTSPPHYGSNDEESDIRPTRPRPAANIPPMDDGRNMLLASIRTAGISALKPVDSDASSNKSKSSSTSSAPADHSDIMADLLKKMLQERNRKVAHSDSEEGSERDDDEWK